MYGCVAELSAVAGWAAALAMMLVVKMEGYYWNVGALEGKGVLCIGARRCA